jgi:hypothetical protein
MTIAIIGFSQHPIQNLSNIPFKNTQRKFLSKTSQTFLPRTMYEYDWMDSVWEIIPDTTYYQYNEENQIETQIRTLVNGIDITVIKAIYLYQNGQNIAIFEFSRKITTESWDTTGMELMYYNSIGKIIKTENYFFHLGQPILLSRDSMAYTYHNGMLTEAEYFYWDVIAEKYNDRYKEIYTYDMQGILTEVLHQVWNRANDTYYNISKHFDISWHKWTGDIINQTSLLATYKGARWVDSSFKWEEKYTATFDTKDNLTMQKSEFLYDSIWVTQLWNEYLHTYNSDGTLVQTIWNWYNGIEIEPATKYVYSNFFTGLKNVVYNNASVSIYPNPISDKAYISIGDKDEARFFMYDITGRMVNDLNIYNGEAVIEKGNLLQGVYFYRLIDAAGAVSTGKVVIK